MELLEIDVPMVQAAMAASVDETIMITVCNAGTLGSPAYADLRGDQVRDKPGVMRQHTNRPLKVNFFCHDFEECDENRKRARLASSHP